jgi:Gpi18-like mannosyltransferase
VKPASAALRWTLLVLALTFAALLVFLPRGGFEADLNAWKEWTSRLRGIPITRIHETDVNYPPVWLHVLRVIARLFSQETLVRHPHIFKVVPLLFDLATCVLAAWTLARLDGRPWRVVFIALNAAFLYNSYVWGQIDSIYTFFVFAAVVAALHRRPVLASALMVLAWNTKLQAVIFVPCLAVLILGAHWREPKKVAFAVAGAAATQALVVLPFLLAGTLMTLVRRMAAGSVDLFPVVSYNAYNLWYLIDLAPRLDQTSDRVEILGIAVKRWGQALLLLNLGAITFLLARCRDRIPHVFLAFGLSGIAFFYFPTQMHERYICAAVIFLGMHAVMTGQAWAFALVSIATLANLDAVLWTRAIIRPRAVAVLVLVAYVLGLVRLFQARSFREVTRS